MKKDITSRVIRQTKETRRLFRAILDLYEDMGVEKTPEQTADLCFEYGVREIYKALKNEETETL